MPIKCEICNDQESKYKCPKCGIRYCSIACYKNEEKHKHDEIVKKDEPKIEETEQPVKKTTREIKLQSPEFDKAYHQSDKLQELLQYNTVKFHLAKVYRILNTGIGATGSADAQMSTEMKQKLAIDYLNTLRYGGIHYNEAIEEFCVLCLDSLNNASEIN